MMTLPRRKNKFCELTKDVGASARWVHLPSKCVGRSILGSSSADSEVSSPADDILLVGRLFGWLVDGLTGAWTPYWKNVLGKVPGVHGTISLRGKGVAMVHDEGATQCNPPLSRRATHF